MEVMKKFRQKIGCGPVFGPFSKTSDPGMVEVIGHAGFDFVILDMEHGPNDLVTVQNLVRAAELSGVAPIVRVPEGNPEFVSRVLDIGAAGVQVPQVKDRNDVVRILKAARFAPLGERGVCRFVRAAGYSSIEKKSYFTSANEAVIVIQLEGEEALRNLDEILSVKGPDIVFVGPYDLSQSLGVPGQIDHPLVVEKTKHIVGECRRRGIAVGNFTETPAQTAFWTSQGLSYMSFSVDMGLMHQKCSESVSELRRICLKP